jgi:hypothetical protein
MSVPSITCPHCQETYYSRANIESRYCDKCGYIDADQDAPPGIPGVSPKWRQPTPGMQVQAVLAALEGHLYLFEAGIAPAAKFGPSVARALADLKELVPHLEGATWEEKET